MNDVQSIQGLIAQSAQEFDNAQYEAVLLDALTAWANLFADDATVDISALKGTGVGVAPDVPLHQHGRDAIRSAAALAIQRRPPAWHPSKHVTFNPLVFVEADSAKASWDYLVVSPPLDDATHFVITRAGRSYDRMVRRGDRWLIAERRVIPFVRP